MYVKFRTNLGTSDAERIKHATGVEVDAKRCTVGSEHDLADAAAQWLIDRGIAEGRAVEAIAKQPEITAPAKEPEPGSVEKAEADLASYRERQTRKK